MTKIILTGATGLVGGAALRYYLSRPDVTSIVVITRAALEAELQNDPKVTVILHEDFESYPPDMLKKLEGAVACIWALGLRGEPFGYKDKAYAEKVDFTYPVAAATSFLQHLVPRSENGVPFRFVLCSGIGAEMVQDRSFWFMGDTKLLKGRVEGKLHDLAEAEPGLEVYTCRPCGILDERPNMFKSLIFSIVPSVKAVELAATMLELGLHGNREWIWENAQIKQKGSEILQN